MPANDFNFFDFLGGLAKNEIKYLFFDCDNTIVESEAASSEICSKLVNEILEKHNIAMKFTSEELLSEYFGQNFKTIIQILGQKFDLDISEAEMKVYMEMQEVEVNNNIRAKARACSGLPEVLTRLQKLGRFEMAVVSSSSFARIHTCLEKTGLDKFFDAKHIFSAKDSLPKPAGKPSPLVYLHAMRELGATPEQVVTCEDSMSGLGAAKAANLKCLAYVASTHTLAQRKEIAKHMVRHGAIDVLWHWGNYSRLLVQIEMEQRDEHERVDFMNATTRADTDL